MRYIRTSGWDDGVAELTDRLVRELGAGKQVLWLYSGGSNIGPSVEAMGHLPPELTAKLTIMPADERFGPPGHVESNEAQLMAAGFNAQKGKLISILNSGQNLASAAEDYEKAARQAFQAANIVICQLGIGQDGHIAGIMPKSPAAREDQRWISAYEQSPFERLTLTFPALRQVNVAYVFAFGSNKQVALARLQRKKLTLEEQPAQILKELPEAYIFSDQVEDS